MKFSRRRFIAGLTASTAAIHPLDAWTVENETASSTTKKSGKRVFSTAFMHETNTFHPVNTIAYSFSRMSDRPLPVWKDSDLTVVPGISAYPAGGGTITEAACREAMDRVLASLREALPVDAVFLRLHGAMYAEGVGPAETVLVGRVRELVGPKVPIACTFDLHGNIPARMGQFGDILVGYKTAPHIDVAETAELAGRILLDTLQGKVRPVSYVLPIPMILQGEKAMTTAEPFRSLVEEARRVERRGIGAMPGRILAATLFVGCAWTDSPDTGMSVMITADGSRKLARVAAVQLARQVWDARRQFSFGCESAELEEGVAKAVAAKESTVFLTDSGDNVTASTPGDSVVVLKHLIEKQVPRALVAGIMDAAALRKCFEAGEGKTLKLSLGSTIEKRFGPPLAADVEVVRLAKDARQALMRIGGVDVILCEGFPGFTVPDHFKACGVDPLQYKIVVVKQGYLYAGLTAIAPRHIMLLTPGTGDMRLENLTYTRRRKPVFPFEPETVFDPLVVEAEDDGNS